MSPGAIVVGTGFGVRVHVPALRAAGFTVEALVGRDEERTARRAARMDVPRGMNDLDAALALPGVEAVTIATPPSTHAEIAIAAARAGKHMLCEKPFSLDATDAAAMLDAAESAGVAHLVGHEFRWAPERALTMRAIAEGAIGDPRLISLVSYVPLVADPEARTPPWWFDPSAGGGWLGASGSHIVDMVRVWLGEFASVSARLSVTSQRTGIGPQHIAPQHIAPQHIAEDTFTIRFRLASGVEGVLQQTAATWGPMAGMTRVAGTHGTLWHEGATVMLADADGMRELPVPADLALSPAPAESDDPRHRFTHLELSPFTRLCEVLLAGVEGRHAPATIPIPTFADGLAEMRVLDAVRESSANDGATVEVGS